MNKQLIRQTIRPQNLNITPSKRALCETEIAKQIEDLDIFHQSQCIALFIALADEVSTLDTINKWHAIGKQIVLPVIENNTMQFHLYAPDALKVGRFNIPAPNPNAPQCRLIAPNDIELMIVPGVAFTHSGQRLGRGGGFYDRYLSLATFKAHTIGVCYAHQIIDNLPIEPHDICIKKVVCSSL